MPKRKAGTKMRKTSHSHKTKKRLEIKKLMLKDKANKKRARGKRYWSGRIAHAKISK
jgi:hypothetical protein